MSKLGVEYNMDCMDIAKTMVKNRVFDIEYSIDTGCDGGINTHTIKQNVFTNNIYIKY